MKKDYELSNVSFTNKDFFDVYPELLQLAKKLSAKWDPTVSNESDPGVVLIKELALITDKINYISDKYALENNPRSVTQIENARQLYNLLGYYPRWYESAKVNLSLYWDGEKEENNYVTIPKYTGVQDPDGEFVYTILNDILLPLDGSFATGNVEAIEGTYHRLVVNNNDVITLSMLSDDRRIYISNYNVAQNGIFITDSTGQDQWERVTNIDLQEAYTKCFSFNVDIVTGRCYIQFPKDIDYLIGDGLIINYIVSRGKYGNIPINSLNKIVNASLDLVDVYGNSRSLDTGDLKITNSGSVYLGKDPETIDEMYESWKKIAGTFDTLVTLRDYNNASRRYPDYASNAFICDRTNDIQLSYKVMSGTPSMPTEKIKIEKESEEEDADYKLQPYSLKLYGLRSFPYDSIDRYNYYDSTFMLFPEVGPSLEASDIGQALWSSSMTSTVPLETSYRKLIDAISTHQCISHSFESLEENKISLLKNKYNIDLQILATSELTDLQVKDLKGNICKAIYNNFNSKKVKFGEKIDYDDLLECIKQSDSRIKTAILNRLTYDTYAVFFRDVGYIQWIETPVSDDAYNNFNWEENYKEDWIRVAARTKAEEFRKEIVAKNILAGITPFIVSAGDDYPCDLSNYVQLNNQETTHVSTNVIIPLEFSQTKTSCKVKLGPNEVISFSKPNLLPIRSYGAYIYYEYKGSGIPAQEDHTLSSDELICFFYKEADSDARYRFDLYGPGTVVKSTAVISDNTRDIIATVFGSRFPDKAGECLTTYKAVASVRQYDGLSVKDSVEIKKINKVLLGSPDKDYIYFVTNKVEEENYVLEFKNKKRVLGEGEYFIYTNATKSSLEILGSGTELRLIDDSSPSTIRCRYTEISNISSFGSSALLNRWVELTYPIEVVEKTFTNALEGSTVEFTYLGDETRFILDSTGIVSDDEVLDLSYTMRDPGDNPISPVEKVGTITNQKLFLSRMNGETFTEKFNNHNLTLTGLDLRIVNEGDDNNHIYVWKSHGYDDRDHYIYDRTTFDFLFGEDGEVDPEKLDEYREHLGIDEDTLEEAATGLLVTISDMSNSEPTTTGGSSESETSSSRFDWQPSEEEILAFLSWYSSYMQSQGKFRYLQQFVRYRVTSSYPENIPGSHIFGVSSAPDKGGYSYTPADGQHDISEFVKVTIDGEDVELSSSGDIATDCHAYLNIDTSTDVPQVIRYDSSSGIIDQVFFYKDNIDTPVADLNGDTEHPGTYNLYSSDAIFVEGSYEPVSVVLLDEHLEEYNPRFYAVKNRSSRSTASGVKIYTKTGKYSYINFGSEVNVNNESIFSSNPKLPAGDYVLNLAHSNNCLSTLYITYGSTKLKEIGTSNTDLSKAGNYYLTFHSDGEAHSVKYTYSLEDTSEKTKAQIEALTNYKYGYVYKLSESVSNEYITASAGDFIIAKKDYDTESGFSWSDFGVTPTPISSLVISGLMRYAYNINEEDSKKGIEHLADDLEFQSMLDLIKKLDYDHEFNYLYKVPEGKMIRNPLSAESFFNVNHVYNPFTIPEAKKPEILV